MKRILNYKTFESNMSNELTQEQTDWLNKFTKGTWKLNSETGLIDVEGRFNCSSQRIPNFKGVRFGKIEEDFYCYNNSLTSLEGAPDHVEGDFSCYNNSLTSLEGGPGHVGVSFYCGNNSLTSLEGAPDHVGGSFYCGDNFLTSLEGAPDHVKGDFYCSNNSLTSLEGAPDHVGGDFYCANNPVLGSTLGGIFRIMQTGKSYQDALDKYWTSMDLDDQILMYKDKKGLSPEEIKKYSTLARYNNMKGLI